MTKVVLNQKVVVFHKNENLRTHYYQNSHRQVPGVAAPHHNNQKATVREGKTGKTVSSKQGGRHHDHKAK